MVDITSLLEKFTCNDNPNTHTKQHTTVSELKINDKIVKVYTNEFWTAKQRQANSLHEISYRACFKPQLPKFFIDHFTKEGDTVYDPFTGRGTTIIEAALLNRNVISNDINPLSSMLCRPRLDIPTFGDVENRLNSIPLNTNLVSDIDLSMFYHNQTLVEILSLREYFTRKNADNSIDNIDRWIQMVATNRLTGHSSGFFSVYTLPPNQAVTQERQLKINAQYKQIPPYRNTKDIILKKTRTLLKDITSDISDKLHNISDSCIFLTKDARHTNEIPSNSVKLTVTSPPFLDVVQYSTDNWLRCWFNNIDAIGVSKNITMSKTISEWEEVMSDVFKELYRITTVNGYVAFEVGDIKNGKIKLEDSVIKLGIDNGFICEALMVNQQDFTKTSNIWGISNNNKGTNSNKILIFKK